MLVPKLRFPEFRGAEVWEPTSLGSVARLRNGYAFKNAEYVGAGPYRIITIANVQQGNLTIESTKQIAELPSDIQQHQVLSLGDILISMTGNVGRVCRVTAKGLLLNQRVGKLCPYEINAVFFYQSLQRDEFRNTMQLKAAGGAQGNLSGGDITEYAFSTPATHAEQQKIAECLSSVDELIAAQARKVDALKTHKKGLMQQLFPREGETQPRLRFPEFQNAGEWEAKKLGTVCDIQRGKFSHRPRNDPRFFGGPYPFIQTGDVVKSEGGAVIASQSLNEEGLAVSRLFKPTIVLITIAANIGDTGLLQTEGCFTDSVVGLIPKKNVIPVFLELIMRGQKENLNKVATTGAQKNINNEILREVSLLLPSVHEQHRIAMCLSSLDARITAETQKLDALKTHKRGLMQQLFPPPEEIADL